MADSNKDPVSQVIEKVGKEVAWVAREILNIPHPPKSQDDKKN